MYTSEDIKPIVKTLSALSILVSSDCLTTEIQTDNIPKFTGPWDGFTIKEPLIFSAKFMCKQNVKDELCFSVQITQNNLYIVFNGSVNKVKRIIPLHNFLRDTVKKIFSIFLSNEKDQEVMGYKLYQLVVFKA